MDSADWEPKLEELLRRALASGEGPDLKKLVERVMALIDERPAPVPEDLITYSQAAQILYPEEWAASAWMDGRERQRVMDRLISRVRYLTHDGRLTRYRSAVPAPGPGVHSKYRVSRREVEALARVLAQK